MNGRRKVLVLTFVLCLFWPEGHASAVEARPAQDIVVPAGGVMLAARLYLPAGSGPFPAIVFTHGSGPSGRDNARYQEEAEYLAARGIACLTYDKRGYGQSTGDWRVATFEDLASDAVAAVRYLTTRPEVNAHAIGLRGASQSGWFLPIAATRSSDVAFLILISPPGVTPYEQILYDVRTDLEDAGFSAADVESALIITRSGLDFARTGHGWSEHRQRLLAVARQPWIDIASGPSSPDDWLWKWVHPLIDFDAIPLVQVLKTPVLVLLGEGDRECPSQVAGYRFGQALRDNTRSLIRYFPDGDHDLRSTKEPKANGRAPFVPGYLDSMRAWVLGLSAAHADDRRIQSTEG